MLKIYEDAARLAAETVDQLRRRMVRTKRELEAAGTAPALPAGESGVIEEAGDREPAAGRSAP
ncbi:MAG TPA: hypothetical protein VFU47_11105 [Armatimonadota bacterium]|nr:hypothetical protein [Armatimonadota bacterium]